MVYARISELHRYIDLEAFCLIKNFLNRVSEDMLVGVYPIIDDSRIFARVDEYSTKESRICSIEAHERYVDIQATIVGSEGISIFNRNDLIQFGEYDSEKDVAFFENDKAIAIAHTNNIPGYFTMLMPEEAHRPQERCGTDTYVKKFVLKIDRSLVI